VWAGDCADADPEGIASGGGSYWPGAQRDQALDATAGATTSGTISLHAVDLLLVRLGLPLTGVELRAVHAADTGCPAGETVSLGTTDVTGLIRAALPYGTWTIQAVGESASGSWPVVTLSPLDTVVPSFSVVVQ
jgi:hypothetical protein